MQTRSLLSSSLPTRSITGVAIIGIIPGQIPSGSYEITFLQITVERPISLSSSSGFSSSELSFLTTPVQAAHLAALPSPETDH